MAYADVHGIKVYYEVTGEGPPLVMIMGLGANADWWEKETVSALGEDFRVLVFDNRDAGRSSASPGPYTIRDLADDTAELMDRLGIDRANILGASMGGMVAQEFALNYPGRVGRLVLCCTTPGQSGVPPTPEALIDLTADRSDLSPAQMVQQLLKVLFSPGWVTANQHRLAEALASLITHPISPEGYHRQLMAIGSFEAGPRLGEIKAPTLVLHGTVDPLVPVDNGRILAGRIPGARLELFEGAAHGFMTEQPGRFLELVKGFLK